MSEKYVAEYVEIIDDNGERKGVCVTDTEHTVSFEVKDEYVAMELCGLLNAQQDQIIYWKHKVSSLLWILGQFDKEKVKKLLEGLDNNHIPRVEDLFND